MKSKDWALYVYPSSTRAGIWETPPRSLSILVCIFSLLRCCSLLLFCLTCPLRSPLGYEKNHLFDFTTRPQVPSYQAPPSFHSKLPKRAASALSMNSLSLLDGSTE